MRNVCAQKLQKLNENTFFCDYLLEDENLTFNELIKSLNFGSWAFNWPVFKTPLRNTEY